MVAERVKGWEQRLALFVESRRHRAFQWGGHDCGLFAADAAREITGVDFAAALRGYRTAGGAMRALKRFDCDDVTDVPARVGLVPRQNLLAAMRGDVVSWRGQLGLSLGVVLGARFAVPGGAGLLFFSLDQAVRAWRLGDA